MLPAPKQMAVQVPMLLRVSRESDTGVRVFSDAMILAAGDKIKGGWNGEPFL